MNKGMWYAFSAYLLWGILPVYLKSLQSVPALQILGHRIVWSVILLALIASWQRQWEQIGRIFRSRRAMLILFTAACLLSVNWLTYIWGVNSGYVVETSLGYFINPLVSVILGVLFLKERLRPWQWAPVGLATVGVIYLTWSYGRLPWIALVLAFSFGAYGLIKKTAPATALQGLMVETSILFFPAFAYLSFMEIQGSGSFGHAGGSLPFLLSLAGIATTVPLLLFASGARLIPLSTLGILQYIAPSAQFLLGVLLYHEPFGMDQLIGFGMIWLALIFFTLENLWTKQRAARINASSTAPHVIH
jgi:chloramphenicol-sensitive protein RarD